jgi:putative oxidoreductase
MRQVHRPAFFEVDDLLCDPRPVAIGKELSSNVVLLVLRAVVGANMALLHGWDKLHHFSSRSGSFHDPIGMGSKYALMLAVAGELFGGILLATGLLGRVGAFLVAMAVSMNLFANLRGSAWHERELWGLYLAASLTVLFLGTGRYALDTVVWKKLGKGGAGKGASGAKRS